MTTVATTPTELTITVTDEERALLQTLLQPLLRDKLIEVHRTDAPAYRVSVQREADALENLLDKLRRP